VLAVYHTIHTAYKAAMTYICKLRINSSIYLRCRRYDVHNFTKYWGSNTLVDPQVKHWRGPDPCDPCGVDAYGDRLPKLTLFDHHDHAV